jgi:hypothetical protein
MDAVSVPAVTIAARPALATARRRAAPGRGRLVRRLRPGSKPYTTAAFFVLTFKSRLPRRSAPKKRGPFADLLNERNVTK